MSVDGKAVEPGVDKAAGIYRDAALHAAAPLPIAPRVAASTLSLEERLRGRFGYPSLDEAPPYLRAPAKDPGKPRPGCILHSLTMMDRNLLIGAGRQYCGKKGNRTNENHDKLNRLDRLLDFTETLDYHAMVKDANDQLDREWRGAAMRYNRWRDYRAGLPVKIDTALEGEDGVKTIIEPFDLSAKAPPKPTPRPPMLPEDEERGPERIFQIPAKLVVWIQKVLTAVEWNAVQTKHGMTLCRIFDVEVSKEKVEELEELDAGQEGIEPGEAGP